jgi:uncharacterized damage-inducible protein DinB
MSSAILHTGKSIRNILLHHIQSVPEELFDVQPEAFNNTIRWNLGHIMVSQNGMFAPCQLDTIALPESYAGFFQMGTKPADWTVAPPSKDEMIQYLSQQLNHLSEISPEKLNESLAKPIDFGPLHFETVGEMVNFAFVHEAMHAATISSLLKVINHQQS